MQSEFVDLERAATGQGGRFYGVYPALVTGNPDQGSPGSIRIRLPMFDADTGIEVLARVAVPMAGHERGTYFMPEVGDEVLVAFEGGDPRRAYVIGAMWSGEDAPPVTPDSENDIKAIVSRNGLRITLDDSQGASRLSLQTPDGRAVVLNDDGQTIEISDNAGNNVRIGNDGIRIASSAQVTVEAQALNITAAVANVSASMTTFSGAVKCDTLIANVVNGASYTPGEGNIW